MIKRTLIALALVVLAGLNLNVLADNTYPESGLWWDPDASGRGYIIERQEDVMFIITFHYGPGGDTEWLTSQGLYVSSEEEGTMGVFEGPVYQNSYGQCIGCDYVEPINVESAQGPLTITFSDYRHAVLEWEGETILINKHIYVWEDIIDELLGTWMLTLFEDGGQTSHLVNIEDVDLESFAEVRDIVSDELVGTVLMVDDEPVLTLEQASEPELPIFQPTRERFYAGYSNDEVLQAVAVRLDDMPAVVSYEEGAGDANFEVTDWTDETHSKSADPNFAEVFEDNTVKRLDIVITQERWQSMLDDMTETYGTFGVRGAPGALIESDEDPIFVPAEVFYNGMEWYRVGVRFKGNSSLQSSWQNGIMKLSFKLDFDEFEDDYPQIDNQRFYGFKKLHLKNNYEDASMMREKVAGDVFRNAGLAGSHTAFYTLYVDHGDGPQYFGVYTMVEEVDGSVLDTQFSDDDGNLYKPDGDAASFADGTYNEDEYVKKNNEDEADFADVESLLAILHDNERTTDAASWRANLETVFDTDVFLKYLAANTVIQNWDTYGRMPHNYYLYNNPDTSQLTWIPWDNNEALQEGKNGGSPALSFLDVSTSGWPLIGYLYADPVYRAQYDTYVQEIVDGPFNVSSIQSQYASYSALLAPYATTEIEGYTFLRSSLDFYWAVDELNAHVAARATAVSNYLD